MRSLRAAYNFKEIKAETLDKYQQQTTIITVMRLYYYRISSTSSKTTLHEPALYCDDITSVTRLDETLKNMYPSLAYTSFGRIYGQNKSCIFLTHYRFVKYYIVGTYQYKRTNHFSI
jgi:hypothetical protein